MQPAPALQQSELFNTALLRLGQPVRRLSVGAQSCYVLSRFGLSLASRPPEGAAHYEALARNKVWLINAESPHPALRAAGYRQIVSPASWARLALEGDSAALRRAMHPKWRHSLARFEAGLPAQSRIHHRSFDLQRDGWVLEAEEAQARARRYRSYPAALTAAMAAIAPRALHMLTLSQDGAPQAAMLFVQHGACASYHIGHTTPRGRALGAHWLLLWRAMQGLAAEGVRCLDLGLVDSESGQDRARFKLGAGAQAMPLGGTWLRRLLP